MKVLAKPVTAHVPIVTLSANAMPRDIEGPGGRILPVSHQAHQGQRVMDTLGMALEFAEQRAEERGCPLETGRFTLPAR